MNKILFSLILISAFILVGCTRNNTTGQSDLMAFDDIEYTHKFPKTYSANGKEVNIDVIGVKNLLIHDSMIIFSTNHSDSLWTIASLPDLQIKGSMLKSGQGPNEFTYPPSVAFNTKITKEKDQYFAYLYEFYKGELLKLNISASLQTGKTEIERINDSLPETLFNFVVIDDSTFLCKGCDDNFTRQLRYIQDRKGNQSTPPVFENLNRVSVRSSEDINVISTITKYEPSNGKVVEMPVGLNYINLYSLDGSTTKTICIGKKTYDIEQVQAQKMWDRIYTFSDIRLYKDFWAVMYINETEKDYQKNTPKKKPSVLLFDWSGNPVAEIKLDQNASCFDIDLQGRELYTLDAQSDLFFKYDLSSILQ